MQRRAAAIYVALFIVIGAASYSLVATAETPEIQFQDPAYELSSGDTFEVGSQTYNLTEFSEGSGTIEYTNESARHTETWENNSTVTLDDTDWTVLTPDDENASEFTLREALNRSAILQGDENADNETITRDGEEYVVIEENGTTRLVPADEYFPEPETRTQSEGDSLSYEGNETTVENVTADAVELSWIAPETNSVDVSSQANVTLGDQTYLAYAPNNETLQLTQDFESYRAQQQDITTHGTYENGLWGVSILSFLTAVLLVGFAYMPSRY